MNKIVGIRFQEAGKIYHFETTDNTIAIGDHVIVDTVRGREMGKVVQTLPSGNQAASKKRRKYKKIRKRATLEEMISRESLRQQEPEVLEFTRRLAKELGLSIKIAQVAFKYDGSKLTVYYDGEKNGALGKLRGKLASTYQTKVDLQSVGPRDVAKMIGGCGACGLTERCCSTFLVEFEPISIRMAKAQDLPLVPAEIAGMCGRLRCCLAYEYKLYKEAGKGLPKLGKKIKTAHGSGRVVERNILEGTITLATEDSRIVIPAEELRAKKDGSKPPPIAGGCGNCPRQEVIPE